MESLKVDTKFKDENELEQQINSNIYEIELFLENSLTSEKESIHFQISFLLKYQLFLLSLGKQIINLGEKKLLFKYLRPKNFEYDKNIVKISLGWGILSKKDEDVINHILELRNNYTCTHALNKKVSINEYEKYINWLVIQLDNLKNNLKNLNKIKDVNDIDKNLSFLNFEYQINDLNIDRLKNDKENFKGFFDYINNDNWFIEKFSNWLIQNNQYIGFKLINDIFESAPSLYSNILKKCFMHKNKYLAIITVDKLYQLIKFDINQEDYKSLVQLIKEWFVQEEPFYEFSNVNSILKTEILYRLVFDYCIHKERNFIEKIYNWILKEGNKSQLIAFNIRMFERKIWDESETTKDLILSLYKKEPELFEIRKKECIHIDIYNSIEKEVNNGN